MKNLSIKTTLMDFLSWKKLVQRVLPWRFRRMVVISGVYGLIASIDKPLKNHAKELSEVLQLSKDPKSINVPIALHSIFVSRFNTLSVKVHGRSISLRDAAIRTLTQEECLALSVVLADNTSPSMSYTHKHCMAEDFFRLLNFVGEKHFKMA